MSTQKTVIHIIIVIAVFIAVSGCQTALVVKPAKAVAPDQGYVAARFAGPEGNFSLVELNDRSRVILNMKNTDNLQIAPVPPGEYALYRITGDRPLIASLFFGNAKFYMQIPIPMMRVITVEPGTVVYIGELDLKRTVDLNPMVDGVVRYTYDPDAARQEYVDLYVKEYRVPFVGFAE